MSSSGVSVVIPAFNARRYISDAVESVLMQEVDFPIQVIVVDDGSTDDTVETLATYENRIKIINTENRGVSCARNSGIAAAQHEFIALLDSDDRMSPGRLAAQVGALQKDANAVLCCTSIERIDSDGKSLENQPRALSERAAMFDNMTSRIFCRNFITTSSVMFRKHAVECLGGFNRDLKHSEDCELWLRLSVMGDFVVLREVFTQYRAHDEQSVKNELAMKRGRLLARDLFLRSFVSNRFKIVNRKLIRKVMSSLAVDYAHMLFVQRKYSSALDACRIGLRYSWCSPILLEIYIKAYLLEIWSCVRAQRYEKH